MAAKVGDPGAAVCCPGGVAAAGRGETDFLAVGDFVGEFEGGAIGARPKPFAERLAAVPMLSGLAALHPWHSSRHA